MQGKQKIILITGVTRGIGLALTDQFIGMGHCVLGCARTTSGIRQLRELYGEPHDFYSLNVASHDEVKSWASIVLNSHGAPDIIINNAGLINLSNPLWDIDDDEFSRIIDVNIKGVANIIRHFVPAMIRARKGMIVNMSSGWGRSVDAEVAPYCASKWAIEGLSRSLALELPDPLAVVALNPGCVNTQMLETCFGTAASSHVDPSTWAQSAARYLLTLSRADNGQSLTHAL